MKKKKFIFDQRKFDLFTKGKPCIPGRIKTLSKEEVEKIKELFREANGNVITLKGKWLSEHEYIDLLINDNIEIENYEECARLLKLKNETPDSEERNRWCCETF
jgi:hypothetical protein